MSSFESILGGKKKIACEIIKYKFEKNSQYYIQKGISFIQLYVEMSSLM